MAVVIADLLPKPVKIKVGGTELIVTGLSLDATVALLTEYKDDLSQFFSGDGFDAQLLLTRAPDLAVAAIAAGVDAVGQEKDIARLPIATQLELLLAVWTLSVPDVKKLRDSLLAAMGSLSLNPEKAIKKPSKKVSESISPK